MSAINNKNMAEKSPSSPGSLPSLPSSPEMDMTDVPRLSSSIWNIGLSPKPSRLLSSVRPVNLTSKVDIFSSDPITSTDLGTKNLFIKTPFADQPRKRGISATNHTNPQPSKMVKIAAPHSIKHTFETAILEARDLLVKAYSLTGDKEKQVAVLDLIEVFRSFTEEGKVITTRPPLQVSTAEPINSVPIPTPPRPQIQPVVPAVPSYAQKVREGIPNNKPATVTPARPVMKVLSRKPAAPTISSTGQVTHTKPITQTATSSTTNAAPPTTAQIINAENVITLVTRSGCSLPDYQAFTIRESIN